MSARELMRSISREIIDELMKLPSPSKEDVNRVKIEVCRKHRIPPMSNSVILESAMPDEKKRLLGILRIKPVRTLSGVTVITVMTKPYPCPHGKCIYCPGFPIDDAPSAYTGREPACMRAIQHDYDPYGQVRSRIDQLTVIGHPVDKIELVIFGGTFTALPIDYQESFIQRCLDAITGFGSSSISEALERAERSEIRVSNIAVETRPDYAKEKQVDSLLNMGITRIELGVQNIYDDIYEIVKRGHKVEDIVESTRIVRDSGMAFVYHMMPGLPGSNLERDFEAFRTIFEDSRFKPDMIKIYPCLVTKGTKLYDQWLKGEYVPYTEEEMVDLIARVKAIVPEWVRIMRIQRDIPSNLIMAGMKKSNLRELVAERMKDLGIECRCIRCREVGHVKERKGIVPDIEHVKLLTRRYDASEGEEVFLSFEDIKNDILIALLRLRKPSEEARREELRSVPSMIVRQLQTYGPVVRVGEKPGLDEWQHRGYGDALLREAEKIAVEEYDAKKISILSGVGVRQYYFRFGYRRDGPYVSKILR